MWNSWDQMQDIYQQIAVRQYWSPLVKSRASRRRCWDHLLINTSWSNPWPWANMLRNMNKCENRRSNFSASFGVVALKLTELIRFALLNQWFTSVSYVPLHREWRHYELSLSLRWACVYFSLYTYTLAGAAHNISHVHDSLGIACSSNDNKV